MNLEDYFKPFEKLNYFEEEDFLLKLDDLRLNLYFEEGDFLENYKDCGYKIDKISGVLNLVEYYVETDTSKHPMVLML